MSEQLAVLQIVATRLQAAGIAYMVSGSTAMNYYAQPRMTRDIDLVVDLLPDDGERFARVFSDDFYCDAAAVREAVAQRGLFNLIHLEHMIKIDFIVRKETPYRREEFSRRRGVVIDGVTIQLVAAEDLLLSKLEWARESRSEVQVEDVRNLIACVPELDWPYVERWAPELGVEELLREVRV